MNLAIYLIGDNVMEKLKKLKKSVLFAVIWSISTSVLAFLTFEQNVKKLLVISIMNIILMTCFLYFVPWKRK
jgi:hypothetical protein